MKIRSDFVSNSSSSSFIFYTADVFRVYDITKEKLENALIEMYGEDKYKEHCMNSAEKPFEVFDLHDETELVDAKRRYESLLSGWDQALPQNEDYIGSPYRNTVSFKEFLNAINEAYDTHIYQGTDKELKHVTTFSYRWCRFSQWLSKRKILKFFLGKIASKLVDKPLKKSIKKVIHDVRQSLRIQTNAELLEDSDTRFFIHMDDNVLWEMKGIEANSLDDKDTTKSYTYKRFMKMLFRTICKQNDLFDDGHDTINLIVRDEQTQKLNIIENYGPEDFMIDVTATYNVHEG